MIAKAIMDSCYNAVYVNTLCIIFLFRTKQILNSMARILERGITLIRPYSGNKSDEKTSLFFLAVFEMKYTGQ